MNTTSSEKLITEYSSTSSIENYVLNSDFGIEGLELLIETFKALQTNFANNGTKRVAEDSIVLDDIDSLTQGLDSYVKPMIKHFLTLFKAHTMKSVLEQNISVVLTKNTFVKIMLKSLKTNMFMREEPFEYSVANILKMLKERKRMSRYNQKLRSYLKSNKADKNLNQMGSPSCSQTLRKDHKYSLRSKLQPSHSESLQINSPESGALAKCYQFKTSPQSIERDTCANLEEVKQKELSIQNFDKTHRVSTTKNSGKDTIKNQYNSLASSKPQNYFVKINGLLQKDMQASNQQKFQTYKNKFAKRKSKPNYATFDLANLMKTRKPVKKTTRNMTKKLSNSEIQKMKNHKSKNYQSPKPMSGDQFRKQIGSKMVTKANPRFKIADKSPIMNSRKFSNRNDKALEKMKHSGIVQTIFSNKNLSPVSLNRDYTEQSSCNTSRINAETVKNKLIQRNKLSNFLNAQEKFRTESTELKDVRKNCTFKPNLEATKKVNFILMASSSQKSIRAGNSLTRKFESRKQSQRDMIATPESYNTVNSISNLHQYSQTAPKKKVKRTTKILNVNLTQDKDRCSKIIDQAPSKNSSYYLNGVIRNGYSQRSQERKNYEQKVYNVDKSFEVSQEKLRKKNLINSKSQTSFFAQSYYTLKKPDVSKEEPLNTKTFDSLKMNLSCSDLNEVMSCHHKSMSHLHHERFASNRSNHD
ncbi:unnamed protein product [Moneuplotes crassus]|uniref:Uncharacterized protein n=1 Tax=Euplotes crassus TaxID=5936 RepID=A0AAD1ULM0_EUPCR|nr:unnamed protein product [Moneuplotes crassus]